MESIKIQQKLISMAKQLTSTLSFQSVLSFCQQAPVEKKKQDKDPSSLDGTDLFSHFTANIIKEEVKFTR